MPTCAVATCKNTNRYIKGTEIKYFSFPKNEDMKKKWIVACRREDTINLRNARICSIHFHENSFEIPLKHKLLNYTPNNYRTLKPNALPTLKLPKTNGMQKHNEERCSRLAKRNQKKKTREIIPELLSNTLDSSSGDGRTLQMPVECIMEEHFSQPHESEVKRLKDIIKTLENKVAELEKDKAELLKTVKDMQAEATRQLQQVLTKIFTPGQISKILAPEKEKVHWSPMDIASAISLRSVSLKAYRYLRNNNYPLPALSTLRRWASTFTIAPGILKNVISLMGKKAIHLTEMKQLCFVI